VAVILIFKGFKVVGGVIKVDNGNIEIVVKSGKIGGKFTVTSGGGTQHFSVVGGDVVGGGVVGGGVGGDVVDVEVEVEVDVEVDVEVVGGDVVGGDVGGGAEVVDVEVEVEVVGGDVVGIGIVDIISHNRG
jgi:hypothetical protein